MIEQNLRPLVIRASAGTGKTFALSNRFCTLLIAGERPDRILATTFTKKAAGEIQDRIFSRLALAADNAAAAGQLAQQLGLRSLSAERAREVLIGLVAAQHRLSICTLDSFFFRMARSYALEIGLPGQWRLSDSSEQQQIVEESLREVLREDDLAVLLGNVVQLADGESKRSVLRTIGDAVGALHGEYLGALPRAWRWMELRRLPDDDAVRSWVSALRTTPPLSTAKGEPNKNWLKATSALIESVEAGDWSAVLAGGPTKEILLGKTTYARSEIPGDWQLLLRQIAAYARDWCWNRLATQLRAAHEIVTRYDQRYGVVQARSGTLTFDDVKRRLALVGARGDLERLYFRLDSAVHHLLLDEFQDTSPLEWRVLEPIADEILAKADGVHSFFCVGDTKQAIYGWRGGRAEIFDSLQTRWQHLQAEGLDRSYRSSPVIVQTVNAVFSGLVSNAALSDFPEVGAAWDAEFHQHQTARKDLSGFVAVYQAEDRPGCLSRALQIVREIYSKSGESRSIGVLVRRNQSVAEMLMLLRRAGIEAAEEGGNPLTDSLPVKAICSLLRMVDHPGDTISRFHVAETAVGRAVGYADWTDERRTDDLVRSLRSDIIALGFGEVVWRVVQAMLGEVSSRDRERLLQLVELGYRFDARRSLRTEPFIDFVASERVHRSGRCAVRVMTIHQSKGLEFDAVVLPELDGGTPARSGFYRWSSDPLGPAERLVRRPSEALAALDPALSEMRNAHEQASLREALCVLYVALTRARQAMFMVIPAKPSRLSGAAVVQAALSSGASAAELYRAGDEAWNDGDRTQAPVPAVPEDRPCRFSVPTEPRWLPRYAPSSGAVSKESRLHSGRGLGARIEAQVLGKAVHRVLQEIEWQSENEPLADRPGEEKAIELVTKALSNPQFRALFAKSRYIRESAQQCDVLREIRFTQVVDGQLVEGACDRVVIVKDSGGTVVWAEVVDFKTDADGGNERGVELYRSQLLAYQNAVSEMLGIARDRVRCVLAYVRSGEVCDAISPDV